MALYLSRSVSIERETGLAASEAGPSQAQETRTSPTNSRQTSASKEKKPAFEFITGVNTEPEYFTVIKQKDIAAARELTRKNIFKCIEKLNEDAQDNHEVKTIYIGKSYLEQQGKKKFDTSKPDTWGKTGISRRFSDHEKNNKAEFLIVVAVVTEKSIKALQKRNESFEHPEEYVLMLEKRLIAEFMRAATKRPMLLNETKDQGKLTEKDKAGYVIYMTAIRGGKLG